MSRQIFLDTETTGLDPKQGHRLIEFGAIEMINRRLTRNNLHFYFNPEREVDPGALAVHGLNDAFLSDKSKFADSIAAILEYIHGAELIIHNAVFDLGFLHHELRLANAPIQDLTQVCEITDTLVMARKMHPGQKNSLDALCKRYRVDNTHRTLHGALLDAEILARVYLAMTGGQSTLLDESFHASEKNDHTVEEVKHTSSVVAAEFPVHAATESELLAHEAFLNVLDKKHQGACVWREWEK